MGQAPHDRLKALKDRQQRNQEKWTRWAEKNDLLDVDLEKIKHDPPPAVPPRPPRERVRVPNALMMSGEPHFWVNDCDCVDCTCFACVRRRTG